MTNAPEVELFPTQRDLTEIEADPRYLDLVARQSKALVAMMARQAQDRVTLTTAIQKERKDGIA